MAGPAREPLHVAWVGAAGSGTGFGLVRSLREGWGDAVRVIAADINRPELVAASALADESAQLPPLSEPGFADELVLRLRGAEADTYSPILDAELLLAAELREAGRLPPGLTAVAPGTTAARLCLDKLAMARWLDERGLPSPATWPAAEAEWQPGGLILKPRRGFGSAGVRRLDSPAEAEAAALAGDAGDQVVQALCDPPEVTVDVFRARDGSALRAVCRERLEVKAGVCTKARVFEDAELSELARALGDGLELGGAFCFQVMRAGDGARPGGWQVTDVNPRHGAASRLSAAIGVDVIAAGIADAWGEDPSRFLGPIDRERFVVRQYAEYAF